MDKKFALYGCGKAGLSVALALKSQGYEVVWVRFAVFEL